MLKIPKVILLIERSRSFGRGLLHGIIQYSNLHGPWLYYMKPEFYRQEKEKLQKWFSEPIELAQTPPPGTYMKPGMPCEWNFYTRYGKMHFIYDYSNFSISELQKKFAPGRLLLILRPGEFAQVIEREKWDQSKLQNLAEHVVHRINRPDGTEVLWLCRF